MYPFNAFYNNWLDCRPIFEARGNAELPVNLSIDFFENLKFDAASLRQYRIEAAIECAKTLGDNPALCISGGIDSQCMLQAWSEANLKFKTYVFIFNDNLNIQDVSQARLYCKENDINLTEYNFDVVSFLVRENWNTGIKYSSSSPHFNTHYKFFDLLRDAGHTGVCCGGLVPVYNKGIWGENFSKNVMNYIRYVEINNFPCHGSFLSFHPNLAWATGLLTPMIDVNINAANMTHQDQLVIRQTRYESKVEGYLRAGFNILRQDKKYTGFEFVKSYFQEKTNDGWAFEKKFRHPLEKVFKGEMFVNKLKFNDPKISELLDLIYSDNMTTRLAT